MKKPLLIFAHKKEAAAFLKAFNYQKHILKNSFFVYETNNHYLFIGGSGLYTVLASFSYLLGKLEGCFCKAINLGIVGALRAGKEVNTIYEIRTAYVFPLHKFFFQSFSLIRKNRYPYADCISSLQSILDEKSSEQYSCFAHLVDQELWGIAYVCSKQSLKLHSLKIVSDIPKDNPSSQKVIENASFLSEKLLVAYQDTFPQSSSIKSQRFIKPKPLKENLDFLNNFHITFSQNNQIKTLLQKWSSKYATSQQSILENKTFLSLLKKCQNKKNKTKTLIQFLIEDLDPFTVDKIQHFLKREKND